MAKCNPEEFLVLFQRIVHKYNQFEHQSRNYGTDMLITVAEIHTIDAIGNADHINLRGLAEIMGVTKGSASQMVYKLVEKGLVNKTVSPVSDREIVLTLTQTGRKAYEGHRNMHFQSGSKMNSLVMDMPQEVLELSKTYLERFEVEIDKLLGQQ